MTKRIARCIYAVSITLSSLAWGAAASPKAKAAFTAAVPFEFVVGGRTLPAGTYTFEMSTGGPTAGDRYGVLTIRSVDHSWSSHSVYLAVVTDVVRGFVVQPKSTAVFSRADGRVFLARVWQQGRQAGFQLRLARVDEPQHGDDEETARIRGAVSADASR